MASDKQGYLGHLNLENAEDAEVWIHIFEANVRYKKILDNDENKNITDFFISSAGIAAIRKISTLCRPRKIQDLSFKDIKEVILQHIKPSKRIILAERSKFMRTVQKDSESLESYIHRLKDSAKYCDFDKLNSVGCSQSGEDELIQMRLIDGLCNFEHKNKILEFIQSRQESVSLVNCVEFLQQLEMISSFSRTVVSDSINNSVPAEIHFKKERDKIIQNCKYCGGKHAIRSCPAFGKQCSKCLKRNHFSKVCKAKNVNYTEEQTFDAPGNEHKDVWHISNSGMVNNIKMNIDKMKLNDFIVDMQIDTGADVSVISSRMWNELGCPQLEKYGRKLEVYDGHNLRTL